MDACERTDLINACYAILWHEEQDGIVKSLPIHELSDAELRGFYLLLRSTEPDALRQVGF